MGEQQPAAAAAWRARRPGSRRCAVPRRRSSSAWKSGPATRSRAAAHSANSGSRSTAMYSTLRNCRDDGLYGLQCHGIRREQRMQRIQADERRAVRCAAAHARSSRSAKSPMPQLRSRAQRVQLHRDAPQPPSVAQHLRLEAAAGRGNQRRLGTGRRPRGAPAAGDSRAAGLRAAAAGAASASGRRARARSSSARSPVRALPWRSPPPSSVTLPVERCARAGRRPPRLIAAALPGCTTATGGSSDRQRPASRSCSTRSMSAASSVGQPMAASSALRVSRLNAHQVAAIVVVGLADAALARELVEQRVEHCRHPVRTLATMPDRPGRRKGGQPLMAAFDSSSTVQRGATDNTSPAARPGRGASGARLAVSNTTCHVVSGGGAGSVICCPASSALNTTSRSPLFERARGRAVHVHGDGAQARVVPVGVASSRGPTGAAR